MQVLNKVNEQETCGKTEQYCRNSYFSLFNIIIIQIHENKEADLTFTTFITIKCLSKFAAIPFISSHKNIY